MTQFSVLSALVSLQWLERMTSLGRETRLSMPALGQSVDVFLLK